MLQNRWVKRWMVYSIMMMMLIFSAISASAQSLDLDVDVTPLFSTIEQFFPIIFGVLVIPGGILVAVFLGRFIINAMLQAFKGESI